LPDTEYNRYATALTRVKLPLGTTIHKAEVPLEYVYFPTTSVISLVSDLPNGDTAEIAITGQEGMVGTVLAMGALMSSSKAVVQCAGVAYRSSVRAFRKEIDRNGALRNLTLHFVQALMTQMAQTVVCNRHHPVAQQLCRWLLLSLDRLPSNVVLMTDGLVANMLGLRLRGAMTATAKLQAEGILRYRKGRFTVLNRAKMEKRVCICYRLVRDEELRLLPQKTGKLN
jgi:CRP-like cAMP-binding protein